MLFVVHAVIVTQMPHSLETSFLNCSARSRIAKRWAFFRNVVVFAPQLSVDSQSDKNLSDKKMNSLFDSLNRSVLFIGGQVSQAAGLQADFVERVQEEEVQAGFAEVGVDVKVAGQRAALQLVDVVRPHAIDR